MTAARILQLIFIANLTFVNIAVLKEGVIRGLEERWRYIDKDYRDTNYLMLGLFNLETADKGPYFLPKYVNVIDGVVLVEAMRYAIREINRLNFLNAKIGYRIAGAKESRSPFARHKDIPTVMGLSPWQTTYFLMTNERRASPIVNSLTSSFAFDHPRKARGRKPKEEALLHVFRTVPSNELEVKAIIDILKEFRFTYVSIISSNDDRTQELVSMFITEASKNEVCIAKWIWLSLRPSKSEYQNTLTKIAESPNARVTVLFTAFIETKGVLEAGKMFPRLVFISGTSWRASSNTIQKSYKAAKGSIVLQYDDIFDEHFAKYFMSLNFSSNKYTWFAEFWSQIFNCSIPNKYRITRYEDYRPECLGNYTLNANFVDLKYAVVKPVLNAVESIACALKRSETLNKCNVSSSTCIQKIIKMSSRYLGNKECSLPYSIKMNQKGYYYRRFSVLNFDGEYYRDVGSWKYDSITREAKLDIDMRKMIWREDKPPSSFCYHPCKIGEVIDRSSHGRSCCYKCRKCDHFEIARNETCVKCGPHEVTDRNRTICIVLPLVSVATAEVAHGWTIRCVAATGIVLTTIVGMTFMKYRTSRVIKATGRDLTGITLIALQLVFCSSFVFLMMPNAVTCGLQRFIMGFSLNACYTPFMLKTSRIYRIFKASKTLVIKPSFVSPKFQVLAALCLILLQLLLGVMWVTDDQAEVLMRDIEGYTKTAMICKFDSVNAVFNLAPCLIIMAVCTGFAYKTRKFPSNFNEAFNISITMYVSCIMWAIFIPTLFLVSVKSENVFSSTLLLAYFMSAIGMVTLAGLFGPIMNRLLLRSQVHRTSRVSFECDMTVKSVKLSSIRERGIEADSFLSRKTKCDIGTDVMESNVCYCESLKS